MPYLSEMLGNGVEDPEGRMLGRLTDVAAVTGPKFPVVSGIMVTTGRPHNRRQFYIPWSDIVDYDGKRFVAHEPDEADSPGQGYTYLVRDLLDRQIVDMDGYKIVRVGDVRIARSAGELRVMGVDIGMSSMLRRLGVGARRGADGRILKERIVPWDLISTVGAFQRDIRLNVPYDRFSQIHPPDIADIVEQLDEPQRAKVFALIDDPKAAEVLPHILPEERASVAESINDERLSDLLEIMPPDEAADLLGSLPRSKARTLLSLMGIDEASTVRELLGYEPDTAGGRMTTEFVAIPKTLTADQTLQRLREEGKEAETIYYVYVVDSEMHLSGVLSLRDLLLAPPDGKVERLMMRDVLTVDLNDDQEVVAEKLSKYNLLAIPVLDEDHVLKGIVTVDDAIDVIREEGKEDFSQLSGVVFDAEGSPVSDALDPRRWGATLLTFLGGVIGVAMFGLFRAEFLAAGALVYFIPLALRSAHDVSRWSLATAVRDLRAVEAGGAETRRVLASEYTYSLVAALLISVMGFSIALLWTGNKTSALAGGVGLFVAVLLSGFLGLLIPMLVRRAKPDLALGAGRMVGMVVMAVSIVSFLVVSGLIVGAW